MYNCLKLYCVKCFYFDFEICLCNQPNLSYLYSLKNVTKYLKIISHKFETTILSNNVIIPLKASKMQRETAEHA